MISEQWAYLLDPGIRQIFEMQREALAAESKIPMLFNVLTSAKAAEYGLGIGGGADWKPYEGRIDFDHFAQGYRTTFTHQEFVDGFKVERKLVDDDLYNIIAGRPRLFAITAMRTREKHAASVFNNAFSASYAGGDSCRLCYASHPLGPSNATVHSNAGSTALSYDAVAATRQLMRSYVDDRGELVPVNPDTLLVPPELESTAFTIWRTMNKPNTADYAANFVQGFLKNVVVWDYLTDANNWFLLDSQLSKLYLLWFDRVPIEVVMSPTSDFDLEAKYRGYMRYSYGWQDWRFVYGHAVS